MYYCAQVIAETGAECALFGIDTVPAGSNATRCVSLESCLSGASAVVLPVPLSRDGINLAISDTPLKLYDIFANIPKETMVFAGAVSEKVRSIAEKFNISVWDYMNDEVLAEKNAYATAEGAIMLMMQNSRGTVFGKKCLVSGYGRIGHYTAKLLGNFGAKVTVFARRRIIGVKAEYDGFSVISADKLSDNIQDYDFIINTVPAEVFTEKEASKMSSNQKYIELASAPYGISRKIADRFNIEIIDGGALPSKYCPADAGKYIAEALLGEFERSGLI